MSISKFQKNLEQNRSLIHLKQFLSQFLNFLHRFSVSFHLHFLPAFLPSFESVLFVFLSLTPSPNSFSSFLCHSFFFFYYYSRHDAAPKSYRIVITSVFDRHLHISITVIEYLLLIGCSR